MAKEAWFLLAIFSVALVILTGFIFYLAFEGDASITGATVQEENRTNEEQEIAPKENIIECILPSPFYCKIWNFSFEDNKLIIQLGNSKNEDYLIREISLESCITEMNDIELRRGNARTIPFQCVFNGKAFSSSIFIRYKDLHGGPTNSTSGEVKIDIASVR